MPGTWIANIRIPATAALLAAVPAPAAPPAWLPWDSPVEAGAALEWTQASDVRVVAAQLRLAPVPEAHGRGITVSSEHMSIDYTPNPLVDSVGRRLRRTQTNVSAGLTRDWQVGPRDEINAGARYREGYSDFRAIWIDEYYTQQFSGFAAFEKASPRAFGASAGWARELWEGGTRLEVDYAFDHENIAPGYERIFGPGGGGLERGRDHLDNHQIRVSAEGLADARTRLRGDLFAIKVSERDWRFAAQGQANWNPLGDWVLRGSAFYARESTRTQDEEDIGTAPAADGELWAYGVRAAVEHPLAASWTGGISLLFYRDNGQVENSLFTVTTAAPALLTRSAEVYVRYAKGRHALRLSLAGRADRYAAPRSDIAPFANLYSDRDWLRVGAAYQIEW